MQTSSYGQVSTAACNEHSHNVRRYELVVVHFAGYVNRREASAVAGIWVATSLDKQLEELEFPLPRRVVHRRIPIRVVGLR